ncbi:MAG: hypothetical protein NTV88_02670 [Candidatus Micrarchaeota archaeon]|nr:hypothetical protein [Candidatus Micrarchaeota archaeon]
MEQKKFVDNSASYFQNGRRYFTRTGFDSKKLEFIKDVAKDFKWFNAKHPLIERIIKNPTEIPYYAVLLAESGHEKTELLSNALCLAYGKGADLSALLPAFKLFLNDRVQVATMDEDGAYELSELCISMMGKHATDKRMFVPSPEERYEDNPKKSYLVELGKDDLFRAYSGLTNPGERHTRRSRNLLGKKLPV